MFEHAYTIAFTYKFGFPAGGTYIKLAKIKMLYKKDLPSIVVSDKLPFYYVV